MARQGTLLSVAREYGNAEPDCRPRERVGGDGARAARAFVGRDLAGGHSGVMRWTMHRAVHTLRRAAILHRYTSFGEPATPLSPARYGGRGGFAVVVVMSRRGG